MNIKIINRSPFELPQYATGQSAGLDLRASIAGEVCLEPHHVTLVPTGIFMELPDGYEAQVRPRSGLAFKHGVTVANAPGTIDPDYRGEVKVALVNLSTQPFVLQPGERIAQLVVARFERVQWQPVEQLSETSRGDGGFGHTGRA